MAQQNDRLLYGSIRYMGDSLQNFEGNIGFGYRQIVFDQHAFIAPQIIGSHLWLDRRHTSNNQTFYQSVIGAEILGRNYDFRANAYLPLTGSREFATPNFGSSTPYLAGHGVYYDTHGFAIEEAQTGYDIEIGRRVPLFTKYIDSIRAYNGVYHFHGKKTDDVAGWRTRFEINIVPSFTIGARAQYDSIRGMQGMAEMTLRFPMSSKKSFEKNDLRSRLDESPERDVDIITHTKLVDSGLMKPVTDPVTGASQRILHVDNRFSSTGNGSAEHPYSSLLSVQNIMKPHDIIYVHHGDGSINKMDQGFVISQPNITLIGSGMNLVHHKGRLSAYHSQEKPLGGDIIIRATATPVIGNSSNDNALGHGILVTAGNTTIKGLNIQKSMGNGIHIANIDNDIGNIAISHIASTLNTGDGIHIEAEEKTIKNISINNISSTLNYGNGINITAQSNGSINNIDISDNTFNNNSINGINIISSNTSSDISNLYIQNNRVIKNYGSGWNGDFQDGYIQNITVNDNLFHQNYLSGFVVSASNDAAIDMSLSGNMITENQFRGLSLETRDMAAVNFKASLNTIADTESVIFTDSTGLYIDHDSENPVFNVDFGGGNLGSIGYNRIYNNSKYEIYLDTRPGDGTISTQGKTVFAQNNYWGSPYGLNIFDPKNILDHDIANWNYSLIDSNNYLFE